MGINCHHPFNQVSKDQGTELIEKEEFLKVLFKEIQSKIRNVTSNCSFNPLSMS